VILPEAELSFYFAAAAQLEPALRPAFTERVVTIFQSQADPGPGDVDRAVRQALIGLWVPPEETELRPPRWHRVTPRRVRRKTERAPSNPAGGARPANFIGSLHQRQGGGLDCCSGSYLRLVADVGPVITGPNNAGVVVAPASKT
jgi:hypothetical protein